MSFLVKDKNFYKVLFSIALPIAAQNFITFTVSLADSLMLGKVGEIALSGANLANQLFFILMTSDILLLQLHFILNVVFFQ